MPQPSRRLQPPPLYAILDPEQTKGRAMETVLRELLEGGIKLLQLRAKVMAAGDFFELARSTRAPHAGLRLQADRQRPRRHRACVRSRRRASRTGRLAAPRRAKVDGRQNHRHLDSRLEQAQKPNAAAPTTSASARCSAQPRKDRIQRPRRGDAAPNSRGGQNPHRRHRRHQGRQRQRSLASRRRFRGHHQRHFRRGRHCHENQTNLGVPSTNLKNF